MSGTDLVTRLGAILAEIGEVVTVDADSVVADVGGTRASVRVVDLAPELEVISVIAMIAEHVENTPALRDALESHNAALSFGSLRRSMTAGQRTDVVLYYTFPAGALGNAALLTLLHIVLTAGVEVAAALRG